MTLEGGNDTPEHLLLLLLLHHRRACGGIDSLTKCAVLATNQSSVRAAVVVDLLVLVQPDLGRSHAVGQRFAPRVRRLLGEDVAHVGAGVDLQAATTLPDLRGRETPRGGIKRSLVVAVEDGEVES